MTLPSENQVAFELSGRKQINAFLAKLGDALHARNEISLDHLYTLPTSGLEKGNYIDVIVRQLEDSQMQKYSLRLLEADGLRAAQPEIIADLHPGIHHAEIVADPDSRHFRHIRNAVEQAIAENPVPPFVMIPENIRLMRGEHALESALHGMTEHMELLGIVPVTLRDMPASEGTYFTVLPPHEAAHGKLDGLWRMHVFTIDPGEERPRVPIGHGTFIGSIDVHKDHVKMITATSGFGDLGDLNLRIDDMLRNSAGTKDATADLFIDGASRGKRAPKPEHAKELNRWRKVLRKRPVIEGLGSTPNFDDPAYSPTMPNGADTLVQRVIEIVHRGSSDGPTEFQVHSTDGAEGDRSKALADWKARLQRRGADGDGDMTVSGPMPLR